MHRHRHLWTWKSAGTASTRAMSNIVNRASACAATLWAQAPSHEGSCKGAVVSVSSSTSDREEHVSSFISKRYQFFIKYTHLVACFQRALAALAVWCDFHNFPDNSHRIQCTPLPFGYRTRVHEVCNKN